MAKGNNKKKRKVWYEVPTGSPGKARCQCHYVYPCPHKGKA